MTGEIAPSELADPETNDILDALAETVVWMKGAVVVSA